MYVVCTKVPSYSRRHVPSTDVFSNTVCVYGVCTNNLPFVTVNRKTPCCFCFAVADSLSLQMSDDIPVHLKQRFAEFLDSEHGNNQKNIQDLVHRRERRLAIDLTALRYFDPALANRLEASFYAVLPIIDWTDFFAHRLLREPGEYLIPLKEAVNDVIVAIDQKYLEQCEVHITFSGG